MKRFINRPAVAAALAAAALVAAPAVWLARAEPGQTQAQAQGQTQTPPGPQGAGANRGDGNRANGNRTDGTRPDINRTRPSSASAPAGPRGMQRPFDPGPVTAADWADISDFMSQYMPWRIAQVQQMPDGPAKEQAKKLLGVRYRGLRAIQGRDPESFEARLGQLRTEDQIYKLVSEIPAADPDRRQQIRDELRPQVTELVDVDLRERQRRVERLEQELARQKKLLDHDTTEHDTIIERRLTRFFEWGRRWPTLRGNNNPSGGAPGAGPGAGSGVIAKPGARTGKQPAPRPQGPGSRGDNDGNPADRPAELGPDAGK